MPAQVFIDGSEVTGAAISGSATRRLNLPARAEVKIPMDYAIGGPGSRLKILINGGLFFHGFVLLCETDSGEDMGYTVYNAQDPWEIWQWRPARDPDGDYTLPTFIEDNVTGPQIMEAILDASENAVASSDDGIPDGPLFLSYGGFETGGVDLTGAPTDWPMSIAEIASLLTSTGEVDIVLSPIDSGGNMAQIDVYNGDFGSDLSGSVVFSYGMGARNVRRIRVNEDMSNSINKLRYLLGPRVGTPEDPAGDQHWRASIEGGALMPDPPQSSIDSQLSASRSAIGTRFEIKIFDARGDEATVGRELYRRLWQLEAWSRSQPRFMVHVEPTRETAIGSFDIGDLVTVQASSAVRGGFSGAQRVYGYTISWDEDGVLALSEIDTSPNQEGAIR
jgi:hypothetical protein